jgi:hypothetical protein
MSGPEVSSWEELFRSYLAATRQRKWVIRVPVPGGRAVRNGALLPPPEHTEGVRTWDQFLAGELPDNPRRSGLRLAGQERLNSSVHPAAIVQRPIVCANDIDLRRAR